MDEWFRIAFVSLNAVSKTHYRSLRKLVICVFLQVFDPPTRAPYHSGNNGGSDGGSNGVSNGGSESSAKVTGEAEVMAETEVARTMDTLCAMQRRMQRGGQRRGGGCRGGGRGGGGGGGKSGGGGLGYLLLAAITPLQTINHRPRPSKAATSLLGGD